MLSNNAVIEIAHATKENTGLYTCKGSNSAGVAEKRIQVVVNSYPIRGDIIGNKGFLFTLPGSYILILVF